MREELRVSEEFLARYNRPGPRYTSYPTAPVWNDSFGPADLEKVHDEADARQIPRLALHAHPLLRKPLPLLRLQRHHPKRQSGRASVPRNPKARDRAPQPQRLQRSLRSPVPLGRRHSHLSNSPANRRSLRLHARSLHLLPRRRNRHRSRPARHKPRASRNPPQARLQPPEHGHPGFPPASPKNNQSRPTLRTHARSDPIRTRPRLRQRQRRPNLRPAPPNRRNLRPHRRPNPRRSLPTASPSSATPMSPG